MSPKYKSLPLATISAGTVLTKPGQTKFKTISLDDNALTVMTDFEEVSPITVWHITPIDRALECMIHSGVRSLFVLDGKSEVVGLVTSYDIQGEKPIRYMQSIGCTHRDCSRDEVLVRDIMDPIGKLQDLEFDRVPHATVGDIVATFKTAGRKHLVVVANNGEKGASIIRGIFSATQLERQLGMPLWAAPTAHTFADAQQAILRGQCN
ncbi:MAG: CBS domain-containing protein [Acidiferrobacterales bacterium]